MGPPTRCAVPDRDHPWTVRLLPSGTIPLATLLAAALAAVPGPRISAGELPADWEAASSEHVTVHAPPSQARAARQLAREADDHLLRLVDITGLDEPRGHIDAYLAPDRASFSSIQPGEPPAWAAGTAYPSRGLIFVLMNSPGEKTARQVFVHEMAHVVLHWSFGDAEPPRWLEEGIAQVAAGELSLSTHATLTRAAATGQLLPLSSLTRGFPHHAAGARVAYAQSRDLILYLRARYGEAVIGAVVSAMAAGAPAEEAIEASTGTPFDELEAAWLSRIRRRYAWITVLGGSGTFWAVAAMLLVAGWVRRRRRHRLVLQRMEIEEQLQDARRRDHWPPADGGRTPLWRDPSGEDEDDPPPLH